MNLQIQFYNNTQFVNLCTRYIKKKLFMIIVLLMSIINLKQIDYNTHIHGEFPYKTPI